MSRWCPRAGVWNVQTGEEVPNLYVMDSSMFPTSVGANPMQSLYTFAASSRSDSSSGWISGGRYRWKGNAQIAAKYALERSEKMRLWSHESQTDHGTRQSEERLLDFCESIQATPQAAERMQPGNGPLHEPAELPQAAAVFGVAVWPVPA